MRLKEKVLLVTGAGRNIGAEIARQAVHEGAFVVVVDLDPDRAFGIAKELEAIRSGSALPIVADVSRRADVEAMVVQATATFQRIDVLVNNVAITDRKPLLELEEEEWDRVLAVSLKSVYLCSRHVALQMVRAGTRGRIISVASTSGYRGRSNATAYTAAKAGILNLTRSMAVQLAQYDIRVNSVTPNKIGSPVGENEERQGGTVKNLIGRNGVPRDLANAVLFLAGPDAEFITGADLLVDGGALAGLE